MDKLDYIQPPLTALVLGHERLRPAEPFGNFRLSQFAFLRAAMSSSRSFWCWGEWIDLPMPAAGEDDEHGKLILFPDYPK